MVDSTGKQFLFSHHMQDVDKGIRYSSDTTYHDDEGTFVYILPKNSTYKLGLDHEGYHIAYTIQIGDDPRNPMISHEVVLTDSNIDGLLIK